MSQRLLDELAMQRRDILAIHLANDPALALDFMVFTLADADGHDWRAKKASTLLGPVASGPVTGFEAKDAPASAALAEFAGSLDESWRSGTSDVERFARFRALSDETRSAWLGHLVSRIDAAKAAFPSFQRFDGWRGREDRILLRNAFADCGISTYCGLAAIWLVERDDARYWEADFYTPRTARAQHWLAQVSGRFVGLFGELRLVGRFSNGEAIFERSRSACATGS